MAKDKPSPEDLRSAAEKRLGAPEKRLVTRYFTNNVRSRASAQQDVTLTAVRVDEGLAARIGAYGDAHGLSYSDTVRTLLSTALDVEEES